MNTTIRAGVKLALAVVGAAVGSLAHAAAPAAITSPGERLVTESLTSTAEGVSDHRIR